MKRESSTAEGTLEMTWQESTPKASGSSAISPPRKSRTAGMRAMFPENTKKAQKVSSSP